MLITLYEDTTPTNFNQDFDENIILPRNSQLKLLNAFCNRKPLFNADATVDTYTLIANDKTWNGVTTALPTGDYTATTLMNTIEQGLETVDIDENLKLSLKLSADDSKNLTAGALSFDLECSSLNYDKDNIVLFTNAPTGYTNWTAPTEIVQTPVVTLTTLTSNDIATPLTANVLGMTNIKDAGATEISDMRNCINFATEKIIKTWFSPTTDATDRPPSNVPYGIVDFTLNKLTSTGNSYWVGLSSTTPDLTAMTTTAGIDSLNEIAGVDFLLYFEGVGGKTFTPLGITIDAGDYIFGAYSGGYWTWEVLSGATENDDFALVIPDGDNQKLEVFVRSAGAGDYIRDPLTTHRPIDKNAVYNMCCGFQQGSLSFVDSDQQLANVYMTSKQDYTHIEDMGQFIKLEFSPTLATKMGLDQTSYEKDTTGTTDKAKLVFKNEKDATTKINGTEPPFVQVNINNLPVKSYTRRDTRQTDGFKGNTSSRCIANVSRFDINGAYNGHLVDTGNNQPLIHLNNAEEINLSQLRIRLTNVDGTIPEDLAPPFCANIEITEGK
tara:strand:+ start:7183 stop:8841 length:1659 start_codon:yes stop_codon:yes gene_type:complete